MSLAIVLTLAAAAYRLLPHPYNVAPLGAIALMGGIWLGRRYALWVPLVALAVTDLVLNARLGYPMLYWPRALDYGAFALIGAAGLWARSQGRWTKVSLALMTPFVFFLISNLGVWLFGLSLSNEMYPRTLAGLSACYVAGLPFLRGTLIGDWGFMVAFVGAIALAAHRQPKSIPATV